MIELLSRNKTFPAGIESLKKILISSSNTFDYKDYFVKMNFQPAFIDRVTEHLSKIYSHGTPGKEPSVMNSNNKMFNPDIQDKLDRLKMKLEGINPSHTPSKTQNQKVRENLTPKHETDANGYSKQHDLKKRI